ncbi:MAG: hypothetical protein LBF32_00760 [Streptococcaceae bacterium]|jgi:hypothetical protein|nr:hypothetical protein [Streptococcaceae bacterium]
MIDKFLKYANFISSYVLIKKEKREDFLAFMGILLLLNFKIHSQILIMFIISNISMIFTNLLPFGTSDGYFILSSILGIFNLRLAGYRAINSWMKKLKTTRYDSICGLWFLTIWTLAFLSFYKMLNSLQNYLYIPSIFKIIILGFMIFKFVRKIYTGQQHLLFFIKPQ